jgi:hypothetical protein
MAFPAVWADARVAIAAAAAADMVLMIVRREDRIVDTFL